MRAFLAIDVPAEIRKRLAATQDQLRQTSSSARWVAPESIHVTLKFIGEISEQRRKDVDQAMAGLTWKPFSIAVRGVGFFPGLGSPRVLWVGLESSMMAGLAKEIDSRLAEAGFEKEERDFRAHLTLARTKGNRLEKSLVKAAEQFQQTEFGSFVADCFYLYQSTLKPGGSVYTKLKEFPL
jgi:2'-5' RNA ligase